MPKLSFDFDPSLNCDVAYLPGYRVKAVRDDCAENPWEAWDLNAPALSLSFGYGGSSTLKAYDKDAGIDIAKPFDGAAISDNLLRRHMAAICAAFEPFDVYNSFIGNKIATFSDWLAHESRERQKDYGGSLTDIKRELLSDALDGMRNSDKLEALAAIYTALGWPALCTSSRGYSQGDYLELLFVITPEFRKKCGNTGEHDKPEFWRRDMERARDLFGAWAWGDVYSYEIEAPASYDSDGEADGWRMLAACGGYYGDNHDDSGLTEAALSDLQAIAGAAQTARASALKIAIRNRIPLHLRAAILANASQPEGVI